jgi:indole-3-glycerol phosphate synthase
LSYLDRLVERKKIVVDGLLRRHQDPDDPLVMRMSYMTSECRFNLTNALKRPGFGRDNLHTVSVLVDMKRRSPTIPEKRNVIEFSSAAKFAELLSLSRVDALMVNLEESEYGGSFSDLKQTVNSVTFARPADPPACIAKDIFIHPIQVKYSFLLLYQYRDRCN